MTDLDRPFEPGTIIANNYRVTTRLGAGGMGTVYLADNVTLSQRVVVKVLRGGAQGAGQEEAQIMANLQHPNVVTVYAHDPAHDCIVMEFLDGASLSTLLEKGIDRVNAIRVALAVADALAAVHRRGLVHRDIKPENVMLALNAGGGRLVDWLKLIDFGLALKVGKKPQVLLGTPEYCGPEQFLIDEPAHPANDVYALGVTIFLMMSGTFPFDGERETLPDQHFNKPPPSLLETLISRFGKDSFDPRTHALLEDLDELLHQMLAKQLSERPTAQEVARRLTRLESSFADAGTFVGAPAPAVAVSAPGAAGKRRSGTAVLKKVNRETPTASSSANQPVTFKSLPDVSEATQTANRSPPDPNEATQKTSTITDEQLRARALAQSGQPTGELAPSKPKSKNGLLVAALGALVLLLAGGLALVSAGGATKEGEPVVSGRPDTSPAVVVEKPAEPKPAEPKPAEPKQLVESAPVARVVEAVDAGLPEELDELSALSPIKKKPLVAPTPVLAVKPPKPPGCRYDEAFANGARQKLAELGRGVSREKKDQLEELGDELATAFKAKDCKAVEVVLAKMRAVVAAK